MRVLVRVLCVCLIATLFAGFVQGAEPIETEEYSDTIHKFAYGGDFRWREVYFDKIPIVADPPGVTRGGANHFFRYRTRLWGQEDLGEHITLKGRIVNEFRHYEHGQSRSWDAMDETVVDQFYLDLKGLFDNTVDLRIGRQDLIYGSGKVILEGTPKDGSRTIYFDAAKLSYKGIENTTVDVLGIYNDTENELAINSQDRDLTGFDPAYNGLTESGGGVYVKNSANEDMGLEGYYLFKRESEWINRKGDKMPDADVNTVGFRATPRFAPFSVNLEAAYQFGDKGDEDQTAHMIDVSITDHLDAAMKPCVGAGVYYLSGDDPDTAKDEGWNPLWARWPQYSELYVYAFDAEGAGRWSNVNMPHVDFSLVPTDWLSSNVMVGYMFAPEKNGPGGGNERGLLATWRNDFTIAKGLFLDSDALSGHLLFEVLEPGDYYLVDDTATFTRLELSYRF